KPARGLHRNARRRQGYHRALIRAVVSAPHWTRLKTSPAWNDVSLRNPHAVADKRARVQRMFAAIAPSYDINNRLHSLWQDQRWRRKAVELAGLRATDRVVDVACGTGDLSLQFAAGLRKAVIGDRWPEFFLEPEIPKN